MRYVEKNMSCGEISDFYTRQMKINLKFSTSVMWRHLRFLHMTDVEKYEITPHEEKFQISPEHG